MRELNSQEIRMVSGSGVREIGGSGGVTLLHIMDATGYQADLTVVSKAPGLVQLFFADDLAILDADGAIRWESGSYAVDVDEDGIPDDLANCLANFECFIRQNPHFKPWQPF